MKTIKMLFLVVSILVLSCSKDEVKETTSPDGNGGQVSRFQLVTVNFGSTIVPNNSYAGTFNNEPVTLSKIDDNKLLFYVKESTPLGQTQLHIPSLNDTKITYEVVEATLTQTPAATLQPLMDYQAQYGATLTNVPEDAPFLQNHNAFTQYFANLSDDDRMKAAKFYKTNKAIFDAVYTTNYDAIQGRISNQTQADFDFQLYRSLILRHNLAVATTVIAGTFAVIPPYEPIETSITAGVALAGIKISSDFHKQIINDVFRVVQIKLNNELGTNNRMTNVPNAILTLTDNQATTLPFTVNAKNFSNTDSNVQKEFVQTYFTAKNKLNGFINQLNTAINWINNNVPLLTLSTIPNVDLPASVASNSFDANASLMQRFTFSVNHPNLSLENATLQSNGQLNLKVKFVGNPTTNISSTLNYTYNDDFSSFSGSFPIEVTNNLPNCGNVTDIDGNIYQTITIGSRCWMKSNLNVSRYRNGDLIPQVQNLMEWDDLTTGAWCYYQENTANGVVYGKLYNKHAVEDPRGLAPEGWHVSSSNDILNLNITLGNELVSGGKMKSTLGWDQPNEGATNASGFTALPGGKLTEYSSYPSNSDTPLIFTGLGNRASWWVGGVTSGYAQAFSVNSGDTKNTTTVNNPKWFGYSVRCVKD